VHVVVDDLGHLAVILEHPQADMASRRRAAALDHRQGQPVAARHAPWPQLDRVVAQDGLGRCHGDRGGHGGSIVHISCLHLTACPT